MADKIAKCPHCGKEIDYLKAIVNERNLYSYWPEALANWQEEEQIEFETVYFICPECDEHINIMDPEEFFDGKETPEPNEPEKSETKTVAASIEIKGDFEVIYRCGACGSLNLDELIEETDQITCGDCQAINLRPQVDVCDCATCQAVREIAAGQFNCASKTGT
jgi:DNA-directed RNA polymerase subunit RPC12/RpoP